MDRIYFAHAMCDYDTAREGFAIMNIERAFPRCEIVNPNTPKFSEAYERSGKDFTYWLKLALSCDRLVFMAMPGKGRLISSGVAKEAMLFDGNRKPVYEIDRKTFQLLTTVVPRPGPWERVMSEEDTRKIVDMINDWRAVA
jgi:hypothetical protein